MTDTAFAKHEHSKVLLTHNFDSMPKLRNFMRITQLGSKKSIVRQHFKVGDVPHQSRTLHYVESMEAKNYPIYTLNWNPSHGIEKDGLAKEVARSLSLQLFRDASTSSAIAEDEKALFKTYGLNKQIISDKMV
jgi:hypothetical protein